MPRNSVFMLGVLALHIFHYYYQRYKREKKFNSERDDWFILQKVILKCHGVYLDFCITFRLPANEQCWFVFKCVQPEHSGVFFFLAVQNQRTGREVERWKRSSQNVARKGIRCKCFFLFFLSVFFSFLSFSFVYWLLLFDTNWFRKETQHSMIIKEGTTGFRLSKKWPSPNINYLPLSPASPQKW